ncbi:MAG: exodeoxyribonuclease VII small subunit [Pseudomonadaceae bacterium]|nr:exodeoxyribonuclease VII small subunit [Pseudomonadaceae bacterium]
MTGQVTFEANMAKLDEVVAKLERGALPLAESLQAFEQGMALLKVCKGQLEQAELQVSKIVGEAGETVPFEGE